MPPDARALQVAERVQALETAHLGFNNFHNKAPPAKALKDLVPDSGEIPDVVRADYVRVLILAYIGNPYVVSRAADTYYQELIARFGHPEIRQFVRLIEDESVTRRLANTGPARRFQRMATALRDLTAEEYPARALDFIIGTPRERLSRLGRTAPMRQALAQLVGAHPRR